MLEHKPDRSERHQTEEVECFLLDIILLVTMGKKDRKMVSPTALTESQLTLKLHF